ncbi:hypothetical protein [Aquirhabdus sp.]|uniref:hypothetical protein n=1 Tax=Aquirhabdus sp. TaxID=2824160 RepID=UPI00396C44B6
MMQSVNFSKHFSKMKWRLAQLWAHWGLLDICAMALLIFGIGLMLCVNMPLKRDVSLLSQQFDELNVKQQKTMPLQPMNPVRPNTLSQAFVAFFPESKMDESHIVLLHKLAHQNGLLFNQIDYRYEQTKPPLLKQLSLRINMKGSYKAQRKFLFDVLSALPNLAINRISFSSELASPENTTLITEMSIYYQPSLQDTAS